MVIWIPLTAYSQESDSLHIDNTQAPVDTAGLSPAQKQQVALLILRVWEAEELLEQKQLQIDNLLTAVSAGTEIYNEKLEQALLLGAQVEELQEVIKAIQMEADYIVKREKKHRREKVLITGAGLSLTVLALIFG